MAQIQLPAVAPFKPHGDPTSVSQRFAKWKKSFEYFLGASAITSDARKKATLLHLIGPEAQEIFETLSPVNKATNLHYMLSINIFLFRRTFHLNQVFSLNANKDMENHLNSMTHA